MLVAVDPGTEKFGWAICEDSGELVLSGVSIVSDLENWARALVAADLGTLEPMAIENSGKVKDEDPPDFVLVGSGTGSRSVIERLKASGLSVIEVPEQYSSIRGRELFWKIHPPKGLWRLFPKTLLVPNRSVDDLAAWSLVLDYTGIEPEKAELPCK
ncbi:MAG: endonuclease [Thermovirgaceae bacterium]|nr:endonuclease [Thermovirgaceae bacterium]